MVIGDFGRLLLLLSRRNTGGFGYFPVMEFWDFRDVFRSALAQDLGCQILLCRDFRRPPIRNEERKGRNYRKGDMGRLKRTTADFMFSRRGQRIGHMFQACET